MDHGGWENRFFLTILHKKLSGGLMAGLRQTSQGLRLSRPYTQLDSMLGSTVRLYLEEGLTNAEITECLGLRCKARVAIWVRQYLLKAWPLLTNPKGAHVRRLKAEKLN
jgi:hypothetical protein